MTTSSKFLIDKLKDLHSNIGNISVKYQYNAISLMHLVEILPLNLYEEDERYIALEIALTNDFEKEFPSESILFISDNSLSRVNEPVFSLLPKLLIKSTTNNLDVSKQTDYKVISEYTSQYHQSVIQYIKSKNTPIEAA